MRRLTHLRDVRSRAASAVLVAAVVAGCSLGAGAGDVTGRAAVTGYLWCLAVQLDTGDSTGQLYPVGFWPQGYAAKRTPGASPNGVLLDSSGATVLTEGDTIDVRLHVETGSGDTPCDNTSVATVVEFTPVP